MDPNDLRGGFITGVMDSHSDPEIPSWWQSYTLDLYCVNGTHLRATPLEWYRHIPRHSLKRHGYYYEVFALPQHIASPITALSEHLVITDACILATLCKSNVPLVLPINRQ